RPSKLTEVRPQANRGQPIEGYRQERGAAKVSLMVRGESQRIMFHMLPALSLVPLARLPPKGCWPTTAPVGLSLMEKLPAAKRRRSTAVATAERSSAKIAPVRP